MIPAVAAISLQWCKRHQPKPAEEQPGHLQN